MAIAECVRVSAEIVALIGVAGHAPDECPDDPIELSFSLGASSTLGLRSTPRSGAGEADGLVLLVARGACLRLFGRDVDDGDYHLPHELRPIAQAILEGDADDASRTTYRLAKAIELLCESFRLLKAGALVPMAAEGVLTLADARRLIEARRLIDERWNEKLTLDRIARACGLNRVKLTKGFREMFDCTVASAMAERRLEEARRMLRTTDLPISAIGYDSGYLNNASFARAFGRRFGMSPSDYRAARIAA